MTAYKALRPLYYPTNRAIVRRLVAGENIPMRARGEIREVSAGEIVSDLPPESVSMLLAKGWIEAVVQHGSTVIETAMLEPEETR